MENNYSNYDMLDKMIANNKKAKSWTAFWMLILCLMAAAVLWLAYTVSEKEKTIDEQVKVIQSSEFNLEVKSRIIDSLTANCNAAKKEIVQNFDSVLTQTQNTLTEIVNTDNNSGSTTPMTEKQQQIITDVKKNIQTVKADLSVMQKNIKKENTRLFVQFNNTVNIEQVNRLQEILKNKSNYVIAPAEYIDKNFRTIIKFYNYKNADEENYLKKSISGLFNIPVENIIVSYEENKNIRPTVEIWLGTRRPPVNTLQSKN